MKQSRFMSFIEAAANTIISFVVSVAAGVIIFPLFGFSVSLINNATFAAIFMAISFMRGFLVRRFFDGLRRRKELEAI